MDAMKVLFVGNSFAEDTAERAAEVALALGIPRVKFGVLYRGGCPISLHDKHTAEDVPAYLYRQNDGNGWSATPDCTVRAAVESDEWDVIVIQHGTADGNRYTDPACYERLPTLIARLRAMAGAGTRIAFNLTWLGEPTYPHHEILAYGGDTAKMREELVRVTRLAVTSLPELDLLIPTGTAIENARTSKIGLLTRDGYHLSQDRGRFIAALAFVSTVSGRDAATVAPVAGVDEYTRRVAVAATQAAQNSPFSVTPIPL